MSIQKALQLASRRGQSLARLANLLDERGQPPLRLNGRAGLWFNGHFVRAEALLAECVVHESDSQLSAA